MIPRRAFKPRGPAYQSRARCPICSASLGVRDIRRGLRLIAEHSPGRARVISGEPRCDGSAWNCSDGLAAVAIAATAIPSPRAQVAPPRAVHLPRA